MQIRKNSQPPGFGELHVIWKPINVDDLLKAIGAIGPSSQPVPAC